MKRINNFIIDPSDKRYGKLGHLRKLYKYEISNDSDSIESIITHPCYKSYWFKVPLELLVRKQTKFKPQHIGNRNFVCVQQSSIKKFLINYCEITDEDFFLLFHDNINNKESKPRCPVCKTKIPFTNVLRGYNSGGRMMGDLTGPRTCSRKCQNIYKHWRPDLYGLCGTKNPRLNQLTHTTWFKNKYGDKLCYFYIATIDNKFKFGITSFPDARKHCLESYEQKKVTNFKVILSNKGNYVADLEYLIKEYLGENTEYLEFNGFVQNFRKAFIKAINILDNK